MKKIISKILSLFACKTISRHNPIIIGVTGSVGKTSARDAVAHLLKYQFKVSSGIKNYNNELGYPLSILGLESAGKSPAGWAKILYGAFKMAYFSKNFPEILVLEMGARKSGDIDYLGSIAPLDIAILTSIGNSHLEIFGSLKQIAKEKSSIIKHIKKGGKLIYNFDDESIREAAKSVKVEAISYGFSKGADIQGVLSGGSLNLNFNEQGNFIGSTFKLEKSGSFLPIRLDHIVSKAQIYSVLSAIAVGAALNMNLVNMAENLKDFTPPKGRMNLIKGVKNSIIIDDTYNSAPLSAISAVETLKQFPAKRRIAILGDMLELGSASEDGHRQVGKIVAKSASLLYLVGDKVKFIKDEAEKSGFPKSKIFHFKDSAEAKTKITSQICEGDVILVKGSQGMRMEKIVEALMAEPERAGELLTRQGEEWGKRNKEIKK